MFIDLEKVNIYIKPGATDMRKQINGLAIIVQDKLQHNPFSGSLFLFCNKQRTHLKAIYWDRNGFCMYLKRLEKHKFPWPKNRGEAEAITLDQFRMLLDGIDFWKAHTELNYTKQKYPYSRS